MRTVCFHASQAPTIFQQIDCWTSEGSRDLAEKRCADELTLSRVPGQDLWAVYFYDFLADSRTLLYYVGNTDRMNSTDWVTPLHRAIEAFVASV